jgi:L-iditol 2-dehydrogenase|tara:strand:+ start:128 stop:1174 length:1047 start_codon:yes stop_codon:yes gene_type:complete
MKTLLFPGDRRVEITDVPVPQPLRDQVQVQIKAAGLCGSDLHQQFRVPAAEREGIVVGHHTSPRTIPGHEPAGIVTAVGEGVSTLSVGDRVAVAHVTGCGHCVACRRGRDIDCVEKVFYGLDRDGAMADFMVAEAKDCVVLPESVSFVEGAFWACGAGTGYAALTRGGLVAGETVAIVGLGPVGTAAAFFAEKAGARVIGLDPLAERRAHAQKFGAHHTIDPADPAAQEQLAELTRGHGADLVIEASGVAPGRASTIGIAGIGGRIVFVGLGNRPVEFDIDAVIQKQITCMGSWVFGTPDLQEMIDSAVDLGISVESMVTFRYGLNDAEKALAEFDAGSLGKTVFVWD